ncbi:MAG TPA: HAMP domain-containing sensor histidine kinase [Chitinophagaceae bacterium]|nr:HAMP domain-containing sensor histidine kinase [Chitinophagaceae bacterium]
MKLFTRYNRVNLALTAILLVLSAAAYYLVINRILIHELDEELDDYKQKIETYANNTGGLPEKGVMEDLVVKYETGQPSVPLHYLTTREYDSDEHKMEKFRQLVYSQKAGSNLYRVTIAKPLEGFRLLAKTIVYSTLGILAIIILVSLVVNHFLLKRLWRPFYDSIHTVRNFRLHGKNPPRFPGTKIEEFDFMNQSLDSMLNNARTDYHSLKEFTENASHEIQTPLAIIRSRLDLLIQEESLSEKQGKILDSAYAAIRRISKLNQSLLLLAKIENNQFAGAEVIDVKKELDEKIGQFQELWQDNHIEITANLKPSHITANRELVDILLNNLLGNAVVHNRQDGTVTIDLAPGRLTIRNTAVAGELDKSRLFRRFYKAEQHTHHNGLGLSIVKQICEHAGIRISYHFEKGLHVFSLEWPQPTST